jgi:hypothetical protein
MPVDPFKYEKIYKKRLIERFASSYQYALKMAERSWILNWPADKTFFITYLIVTVDQKNNKNLFLSIKNNRLYASKVEKGEILSGVVKKELKSVFGIEEYKINNITDDGVAKDRYGNSLKRISLKIAVPYFDARRIKHPQYSFEWKEFKI